MNQLRLWWRLITGRLVIHVRQWKTDSPSSWQAYVPGTDLSAWGHSYELAVVTFIDKHGQELGFILKHEEGIHENDRNVSSRRMSVMQPGHGTKVS